MTVQILLASWRGTRFEITQILREVVDNVLHEKGLTDDVLVKRAKVRLPPSLCSIYLLSFFLWLATTTHLCSTARLLEVSVWPFGSLDERLCVGRGSLHLGWVQPRVIAC